MYVQIVIEVAGTTLAYDRDIKLPLYAKAGVPEVWIINLPENTIEIYTTTQTGIYRKVELFKAGDRFTFSAFPRLTISADQLLV